MKKKIVLGLAIFAAVFVLGGLYLIITIEKTTSTLNNLIELHRVEILREQLLMNARKIQSGLALRHTRSAEALDSLGVTQLICWLSVTIKSPWWITFPREEPKT